MTASYREIQAKIRELTAAAESARKAELEQALSTVRELVQQFELTPDDLLGLFKKRRGRPAGSTASQATKGVPKYRDPDTGRTWTGQGKPPNWIRDAADRSVFLIGGAEGGTAKKSSRAAGRRGAAPRTERVGRKKSAG